MPLLALANVQIDTNKLRLSELFFQPLNVVCHFFSPRNKAYTFAVLLIKVEKRNQFQVPGILCINMSHGFDV